MRGALQQSSELELDELTDDELEAQLFPEPAQSLLSRVNWWLVGGYGMLGAGVAYLLGSFGLLGPGLVSTIGVGAPLLGVSALFLGVYGILRPRKKREHSTVNVLRKSLIRPRKKRWVAGVCRALSNRSGIGVQWIRLAFCAACFYRGSGFIAYLILLLVIPSEPTASADQSPVALPQA